MLGFRKTTLASLLVRDVRGGMCVWKEQEKRINDRQAGKLQQFLLVLGIEDSGLHWVVAGGKELSSSGWQILGLRTTILWSVATVT